MSLYPIGCCPNGLLEVNCCPASQIVEGLLKVGGGLRCRNPVNPKPALTLAILRHIPGVGNLFPQKFLTEDDRRILRPHLSCERCYAEAGIQPTKEVIVHYQAGIRKTHGVFALRLLGWDRVRAYNGSMAEWANRDDTPLVAEST